MHSYFQP